MLKNSNFSSIWFLIHPFNELFLIKIKLLVLNKVHARWKNACKINKRAGTFIPYLRVHERSFVDSQLLGIAVNNFRIITGNGKMEILGILTIGEMVKAQLRNKTVLLYKKVSYKQMKKCD